MFILIDPNVLQSAIMFSAPLLIAATGEMITEQSGIFNVSLEGMMTLAASVGFLVSYFTGSNVVGIFAAMLATAILGAVLGYSAVYLRADQVVMGLGLLVLGLGLSSLLYRLFIGIRILLPQIPVFPSMNIPLLSNIPYIGKIFFSQPALVYVAYLLVPMVGFVLYRTPLGLRLRACGTNPRGLDTLGINVFRIRLLGTIVGSTLVGLAGAYLPMVLTGAFTDGMVGGRGWLALQVVIFGRWLPRGVVIGSLLFAYVESLQFRLAMMVTAVPSQLFLALPYVAAIIVLVQVYRRAEGPESLMKPYNREERG